MPINTILTFISYPTTMNQVLTNIFETRSLNVFYGTFQVIFDLSIKIKSGTITSIIGPSGSGKTTLLRTFNRLVDISSETRITGEVLFKDNDIYSSGMDPVIVRKKIGMVFQKPIPFPGSVRENLIWAPKINGMIFDGDELVEQCLRQVHLWGELKDKLNRNASELSAGQQQRLCIARALSIHPEVLLMDEPTSALDPIASGKVEDLLNEIKEVCSVVLVTHNLQQAGRVSDEMLFLLNGICVEMNETRDMFFNPKDPRTENFLSGKMISDDTGDDNFPGKATGFS